MGMLVKTGVEVGVEASKDVALAPRYEAKLNDPRPGPSSTGSKTVGELLEGEGFGDGFGPGGTPEGVNKPD